MHGTPKIKKSRAADIKLRQEKMGRNNVICNLIWHIKCQCVVEISTSLGWYPHFPLLLSHPYWALPHLKLPTIYHQYRTAPALFWTILVSSGNYFSYLNIHLPLSHALFLSNIAAVIRSYSGFHPLSSSYHRAPAGLIGLTGDSLGTHTRSVLYLIYSL